MLIKLILISSEILSLKIILNDIINLLKYFYINFKGPIFIPLKKKSFTFLKSPNGDKDARLCFKINYYKYIIYIINISVIILKRLMLINISPMVNIFIRIVNDN